MHSNNLKGRRRYPCYRPYRRRYRRRNRRTSIYFKIGWE